MSRVGIITCGLETNYGAVLQAFATLLTVQQLGHDTYLMSYSFQSEKSYSPLCQPTLKSTISALLFYRGRKHRWIAFKEFRKKYMKYTSYKLYTPEDFCKARNQFDIFLVGSDQVWNPELGIDNHITLLSFYKSGDGPRKISYASSFGLGELPSQYHSFYKSALSDFESISVREKSGAEIVDNLIGLRCKVVADPVLLLTPLEWNEYLDDSKTPKPPYIFIYDMRHSKDVQECAIKLGEKYGCKIVAVSRNPIFRKEITNLDGVSPSHYLSLIKNARAIVTDSFHGTVFAIIFNKEFYSFCSTEGLRIGGRLANILEKVGLQNRLYTSFTDSMVLSSIDYNLVNEKVRDFSQESILYLKTVLGK